MSLKPHQWVEKPYTVYEIRRELRVRESRHSYMMFDKKYQNIDTMRFDTDKLHTINSYALGDMIDDCIHNHMTYFNSISKRGMTYRKYSEKYDYREEDNSPVYNFPKFVPKDDDFDEEEDEEVDEEVDTSIDMMIRNHSERLAKDKEAEYQAYVQKREKELSGMKLAVIEKYKQIKEIDEELRIVNDRIRNTWIPK